MLQNLSQEVYRLCRLAKEIGYKIEIKISEGFHDWTDNNSKLTKIYGVRINGGKTYDTFVTEDLQSICAYLNAFLNTHYMGEAA